MKKILIFTVLSFIFSVSLSTVIAQNVTQAQIQSIDVDSMSDEQIASYWAKAKAEGYSIEQLAVIAASKGMPQSQIMKLRQRISALQFSGTTSAPITTTSSGSEISNLDKFGLEGKTSDKVTETSLFGYDFFSNPNISFTPNLNLATPESYVLGPGDELLIDIWGAAENNYRLEVNREGAIRIQSVGPVYVSGLTMKAAKDKIISYLEKIYSGIRASSSSYEKVHADVSLIGVRTVQVNIIGEVKVPGTYSLSGLSTVLNGLYAAGGPTMNGTFRNIEIIRGGKKLENFDIYKYLIEGSEEGNVLLRDQDIIIVKAYENLVRVSGNVKRGGIYEVRVGETISDLETYFSGFNSNAFLDRIIVERVNGSEKEILEIEYASDKDFVLRDGDKLSVGAIIDRFENRVQIKGAVYRPGTFELNEGATLKELIDKAKGVRDFAFLERGVIYRNIDDIREEVVSFSVKDVLSGEFNLELKREDVVEIFNAEELKEKYSVSIDGAINNPQTLSFKEQMTLEDLIAMSGGFKEGADPSKIDIFRRVNDDDFVTISQSLKRSSSENLNSDFKENFYLEPFDRVSVRFLKGYTNPERISVLGEVTYPGTYAINNKGERVSDLIEKAGGLSPFAFVEGAYLTRKVSEAIEKTQIQMLDDLISHNENISEGVVEREVKIGLQLEKIIEPNGKGSKYDIILEEGDVLTIPAEKQTVSVRGEVLSPSLIRFEKGSSLANYVNASGGFSLKAKKNKSYVIYANGDIKSTKSFLFFRSFPRVEPGAMIVVPEKPERENKRMSITEIIGLTTALGTLGVLIRGL